MAASQNKRAIKYLFANATAICSMVSPPMDLKEFMTSQYKMPPEAFDIHIVEYLEQLKVEGQELLNSGDNLPQHIKSKFEA